MTTQPTAEQRIAESMQNRADYLAALYRIVDGEAGTFAEDYPDAPEQMTDDEARERIGELGLGASIQRVLRIDLSTGGPADYITATLSRERWGWSIDSAEYHFADWYDHAARPIEKDSALWRYAEEHAELADSIEDEDAG